MIPPAGLDHSTLGEIVAADYRAAAVLDRFGLDFCCGGRRTLDEACRSGDADVSAVVSALQNIGDQEPDGRIPDASWPAGDLVDYIVGRHHTFVRAQIPAVTHHLARVVAAHGARHPELQRIADRFAELAAELFMHMTKEEAILFPYIRSLAACIERGLAAPPNLFGTVRNPIRMMEAEHRSAGDDLRVIRELSADYTIPAEACPTYWAVYEELAAFDADLRQHIHLENNILFPHAVALEAAVAEIRHRMGSLSSEDPKAPGPDGNPATNRARRLPLWIDMEGAMSHSLAARRAFLGLGHFLEHAAAVVIGFVLMIVGLALGVTIIMLPVGLVVGLLGVLIFIGGLFAHIDES